MTPSSTCRRSPRLAAATGQQDHNEDPPIADTASKNPASSSWNETDFDPYAASPDWESELAAYANSGEYEAAALPSSQGQAHANDEGFAASWPGSSMLSHSSSSNAMFGQSLDGSAVAGRELLPAESADGDSSLVTPATRFTSTVGSRSLSHLDPNIKVAQGLSTVTPHEHEASLALATLTMESKKRKAAGGEPAAAPIKLGNGLVPTGLKPNDSFPVRIHAMVTELARAAPKDVEWVNDGEAFMIRNPKSAVLAKYLQKYFNHSNFSSLQRQLNMYGWSKSLGGKHKGAFYNGHFHRDRNKSDFFSIRRRCAPPTRRMPSSVQPAGLESKKKSNKKSMVGNDGLEPEKKSKQKPVIGNEPLAQGNGTKGCVVGIETLAEENREKRAEVGKVSPADGKEDAVSPLQTNPCIPLAEVKMPKRRRSARLSCSAEEQDVQDFTTKLVSVSITMHGDDVDDDMHNSSIDSRFETEQELSPAKVLAALAPSKSPPKEQTLVEESCSSVLAICFAPSVPGSPIMFEGMTFSSSSPSIPSVHGQHSMLPSLVDEYSQTGGNRKIHPVETKCDTSNTNFLRMTLYDGQAVSTSPLEASAACVSTPGSGALTPLPLKRQSSFSSFLAKSTLRNLSAALSLSPPSHFAGNRYGEELFPCSLRNLSAALSLSPPSHFAGNRYGEELFPCSLRATLSSSNE